MIRVDSAERLALIEQLRLDGGWSHASSVGLMDRLLSTVNEAAFPGAVIPRHVDGRYCYYLVASSGPDWRLLRPLALAFVGRTISSFDGSETVLDPDDPFEATLASAGLLGAAITANGTTSVERQQTATALDELRALVIKFQSRPPELRTTADLFHDFQLALAARDRASAEQIIDQLRGNLRLDGLNQVFMRIEVDAVLEAWPDLWARSYYRDACRALRPPRVTAALARAAYWSALSDAADSGDIESMRDVFETVVAPRCQGLFGGLPPATTPDVVLPFILGWELDGTATRPPDHLQAAIQAWPKGPKASAIGLLAASTFPASAAEPSHSTGLAAIRDAVFAAVLQRTAGSMLAARRALEDADPGQVDSLRAAELYRDAIEMVLDSGATKAIDNWQQWANMIPLLDPSEITGWARDAIEEKPIWMELSNSPASREFAGALDKAMGAAPEATGLALPFVLDGVLSDPEWPRSEFQTLYRSLLDLVLYDDVVTPAKVASASRVTAGLLSIGLDGREYADVLRDLGEWAARAASTLTLDRLLDLGEVTVTYPCPDEVARRALWARILLAFRPFQVRLDAIQRGVLGELDRVVGGDVPLASILNTDDPTDTRHGAAESPQTSRSGRRVRVALYSLVESMAKRTKALLETAYPTLEVQISTGFVADRRLDQQASDADLFVICWTRATHAATNAIRARRGDRPLLYASGAGSTSLIREIVERLSALGVDLNPA